MSHVEFESKTYTARLLNFSTLFQILADVVVYCDNDLHHKIDSLNKAFRLGFNFLHLTTG